MRTTSRTVLGLAFLASFASTRADEPKAPKLAPGVRGLVTRAPHAVAVDGSLREWTGAYCTPVQYGHPRPLERAAQFFTMWDDQAFYIGLRCLDTKQGNSAPLGATFNGDAVEFYLDTRAGDSLRAKDWSTGAIHFYFSAFEGKEIKPRWVMRKGIATSDVVLKGVEIAATRTAESYELEFKLPWSNFPDFKPEVGALMALDAELCYADGGARTDRTFAYGSPLSVQQPASQAKVQLVTSFEPDYLPQVGPASFPLWVATPWVQEGRAKVFATVAVPPAFLPLVGEVEVRAFDADGKLLKTIPTLVEEFGPKGLGFGRAVASWSIDDFAPGTYFVTARIVARTGKTLVTVAPRMVDEGIISGR